MNSKNINIFGADCASDTHEDEAFFSFKNQFLIAIPSVENSIFSRSVTYVCNHNEHGAMGVIINQPSGITLGDIFEQLDIAASSVIKQSIVLAGGPVSTQQGLVLHRDQGTWESTMHVTPEICITGSKDIVHAIAKDCGPESAQLALGYAGWEGGQLEEEINNNYWLTMPADSRIMFDTPSNERWNAAALALGVNLDLVSNVAGHA